jgi:GDSL-like lipase/acylhydrolase family protein
MGPTGMPIAVRRPWASNLALLVTSLALSLGGAEVLFRLYLRRIYERHSVEHFVARLERGESADAGGNPYVLERIIQLSPDPRLIYELRPHLHVRFGMVDVETNGAGMRASREYAVDRPPSTLRIVGIGDSGMFGWDVPQGRDYLADLERALARRGNGTAYEVLNLAVPGYNTQQEVERLRDTGLAYDPQVVVVGWCVNDTGPPSMVFGDARFDEWDRSYLYAFVFDRARFAEMTMPVVREWPRVALEHEMWAPPTGPVDPRIVHPVVAGGMGVEGVRRAFADLAALAVARGFHVLVFGPLGAETAALARDAGLDVYDTRAAIPLDRYPRDWGVHHMHPRPRGHHVLARYLERALARRGWLDGRAFAPSTD